MTNADQFYVFLVCVACGCASGVIYDVLFCALYCFQNKWVKIARDFCFFLLFSAVFIYVSAVFGLPDFRLFMFLGCILGLFLYLKSIHKTVAFFAGKIYNGIKRLRKDKKLCFRKRKPLTARRERNGQKE